MTSMDLDARKQLAAELKGREVRNFAVSGSEVRRDGDGLIRFSGVASTTDTPYDMGYYQETIKRGAFAKTLSEKPDVQLLVNHTGLPLARTTNGSLELREEERGLVFDAACDENDPDAATIARKIESGLLDQCSFAFRVTRQDWDEDYENREIAEVNMDRGDVSIVNYGANPTTSVTLREARDLLSNLTRAEFVEFMASIRPDDKLTPHDPDALTRLDDSMVKYGVPFQGTVSGATTTMTIGSWYRGKMSEHPKIVAACAEFRAAGATDDQMDALQNVLNLIDASDTNVDKALIALSAFMGVTNPDIAQDKALDRAAPSLDTYRARAMALSLAAR